MSSPSSSSLVSLERPGNQFINSVPMETLPATQIIATLTETEQKGDLNPVWGDRLTCEWTATPEQVSHGGPSISSLRDIYEEQAGLSTLANSTSTQQLCQTLCTQLTEACQSSVLVKRLLSVCQRADFLGTELKLSFTFERQTPGTQLIRGNRLHTDSVNVFDPLLLCGVMGNQPTQVYPFFEYADGMQKFEEHMLHEWKQRGPTSTKNDLRLQEGNEGPLLEAHQPNCHVVMPQWVPHCAPVVVEQGHPNTRWFWRCQIQVKPTPMGVAELEALKEAIVRDVWGLQPQL
eukprot:TRINITY_DN14254_c0_g1_i1.p1 TRINITY_DN14254_c0_g1~~TRINITY_DN14254_c0_g1_i1.p1  ORF type:complete len:290 (+),score=16.78 TRINITY_DN14254_c0_g1_i1:53-922(+)